MSKSTIILGIDPGTTILGYGIIEANKKQIQIITYGLLKLQGYENHALKLKRIFERILQLIETYHPDEVALEAPFYGKNVQSMLKLGRAQGVAMAAALYREVPITEYAPKSVKLAITGNGNASKEQIAGMLIHLLKLDKSPEKFDETDALAVAVCHHFQMTNPLSGLGKKQDGWKNYIANNPDKLKTK